MNVVTFPGLNLEFNVSKIAFTVFGVSVYKYAICIVVGIIVALVLGKIAKEKFDIEFNDVIIATVICIIVGTIGARLYYVLFNLDYYADNLGEIFNFRNGGLAIYGGLIFGFLGLLVYCKIRKINLWNFLDYIVPYVAIAQAIGRWGNFFNVEAYGGETKSFLRMGIEATSGYIEVHPVFLYESILMIVIFAVLKILQKHRKFEGEIFTEYCLLYSFVRFFLEGMRVDSLMFFSFRISQVLSAIIFVVSLVALIIKYRKQKEVKN